MPRAPFQILVLPYRKTANTFEYAILRRSDSAIWQGVAGGGEDNELPIDAAKREANEEAGIPETCAYIALQSVSSIPVHNFKDSVNWDPSLYVIPEHTFGADCSGVPLVLSHEHDKMEWLPYQEASDRFTYDSNRTALWELNQRLSGVIQ